MAGMMLIFSWFLRLYPPVPIIRGTAGPAIGVMKEAIEPVVRRITGPIGLKPSDTQVVTTIGLNDMMREELTIIFVRRNGMIPAGRAFGEEPRREERTAYDGEPERACPIVRAPT